MATPEPPPPLHEQLADLRVPLANLDVVVGRIEDAVRRAGSRRIWPGVAAGLAAGMAFLLLGAGLLVKQVHVTDVRAVCARHGGVQQVDSKTWDWSFAGNQLVVCRDGYVGKL
ncbi:MAG: hypothetical protein QOI91_2492 [Solirubrobacteraceae bacterium]|jgi:hypothetical protein|nr:hypothetical protein [Solirubrobacteraceae bacterium]